MSRRFSPADDQVVAQLWQEGVIPEAIGARLKRPAVSIRYRARKLGFPPIKAIQCMTAKERQIVPVRPTAYWDAFLHAWRKDYQKYVRLFVQNGTVPESAPTWLKFASTGPAEG